MIVQAEQRKFRMEEAIDQVWIRAHNASTSVKLNHKFTKHLSVQILFVAEQRLVHTSTVYEQCEV